MSISLPWKLFSAGLDRSHRLEPAHLVVWHSFQFFAYAAGRFYGCSPGACRRFSEDGHHVINYVKVIPTFLFIFVAPLIGMFVAFLITVIIVNICRRGQSL